MLVRHFAQQFARADEADDRDDSRRRRWRRCARYDWPGNIRELQNLIERAVILSTGPTLDVPLGALTAARMRRFRRATEWSRRSRRPIAGTSSRALEASELGASAAPSGAAARLGMKRSTLQFRMRKLGIVRPAR